MTLKEAYAWLIFNGKITTVMNFLPVVVCLLKWKYFRSKPLLWLFLRCLITALLNVFSIWFIGFATDHYDILGTYLQKLNIYNTFFIEPFFYLSAMIFLALFCIEIIPDKSTKNKLKWSLLGVSIFTIINTLWGEGYADYQTYGSAIKSLFLLGLAILLLTKLYHSNFNHKLSKSPIFWVGVSVLLSILFAGLIDSLSNILYKDTEVIFYQAHVIADWFYILESCTMAYACTLFPWNGKFK